MAAHRIRGVLAMIRRVGRQIGVYDGLTLRFSGGPRSGPSAATGCYASHESSALGGHALSPGLNDPLDG
jgi:hypothetical protein